MTLIDPTPLPRQRRIPRAPDPEVVAWHVAKVREAIEGMEREYADLYPSGFHRSRTETHERTRRSVHRSAGDLSDGFDILDGVRRHLAVAADDLQRALAMVRGAESALGRARGAIDKSAQHLAMERAEDPEPRRSTPDVDLPGLQRARDRREQRKAERRVPWASEEVIG